ncbi:alpha-amylase family protein [Lutibacter citreus]|uniref:hypothetical protein n=1 Tax=Lutibacter citreus TaxID=2138210 RepID=UPI000DBE83AE|nr:hypothetical protein [Lutibacter citreus]
MNDIYAKLKKCTLYLVLIILGNSCQTETNNSIKAFCIDYNWRTKSDTLETNGNKFAAPGAWADFDPKEQVDWLKNLGCNVIQSFAVSSNGYAWYKDGVVPEQPGLKTDFLTDLVKLGRENDMKVFGYFCVGSNEKWGLEHPDLSYGTPHQPHIPFTTEYLNYLTTTIKDAIEKTDMDGFMIDWLWNPTAAVCGPEREQKWLKCEQQMYVELMKKPFPGKDNVTSQELLEYKRRAIDRCWKAIYTTTKTTKPNCVIWLSCSQIENPEITNSDLLRQVDWLQNEAGDKESVDFARKQIGEHTRLLATLSTTFLKRMNLRAEDVVKYALEDNIGIYCYTSLKTYDQFFEPVESYLTRPLTDFDTGVEKNIALLARVFHGYSPEFVKP